MGYRNVYNVEGALFMWLNTGGDVWRGQVPMALVGVKTRELLEQDDALFYVPALRTTWGRNPSVF